MTSLPCRFCKTSDIPTKKCGKCKKDVYCGKECQKIDWPFHKRFCNEIVGNSSQELSEEKISPATQEQKNSNCIEALPDEVLLKIFQYLTILDIGKCAQVSKNFRIIAYDSRLWQKVSICSGPIPDNFIEQAMARGTKYIGLANVCASANPKPNFPKTNQVKYLTLSGSNMEETYFRQLISSCHCLTKLSVYHFIGSWEEKPRDLLRGILQNASTLKVLDLSKCESLSSNDIELIVKRCIKLTEANFGQMEHYSTSYLSRNLTTSIEKLGLPATNATNEDIKVLVARCNKLKELDVSWTSVSLNGIISELIQHLSATLEILHISTSISILSQIMPQLGSLPKLRYIWAINEANPSHAGADLPNDFRTMWSRHCPNVAVSFNDCEDHIASDPYWMTGTIWEIQCKGIQFPWLYEDDGDDDEDVEEFQWGPLGSRRM